MCLQSYRELLITVVLYIVRYSIVFRIFVTFPTFLRISAMRTNFYYYCVVEWHSENLLWARCHLIVSCEHSSSWFLCSGFYWGSLCCCCVGRTTSLKWILLQSASPHTLQLMPPSSSSKQPPHTLSNWCLHHRGDDEAHIWVEKSA